MRNKMVIKERADKQFVNFINGLLSIRVELNGINDNSFLWLKQAKDTKGLGIYLFLEESSEEDKNSCSMPSIDEWKDYLESATECVSEALKKIDNLSNPDNFQEVIELLSDAQCLMATLGLFISNIGGARPFQGKEHDGFYGFGAECNNEKARTRFYKPWKYGEKRVFRVPYHEQA